VWCICDVFMMSLQLMPNYVRPAVVDPNYIIAQMGQLQLQSAGQNPTPVLSAGQAGSGLPAE